MSKHKVKCPKCGEELFAVVSTNYVPKSPTKFPKGISPETLAVLKNIRELNKTFK